MSTTISNKSSSRFYCLVFAVCVGGSMLVILADAFAVVPSSRTTKRTAPLHANGTGGKSGLRSIALRCAGTLFHIHIYCSDVRMLSHCFIVQAGALAILVKWFRKNSRMVAAIADTLKVIN